MALTKISTGGVKDDAASQAKIADEAVDEARLQISNAGTNGQFLQKQSGNTGGLTWSDVPAQYTHPNHSGEVTSTADGAQVIASDVVDEDNLKISNSGTNGQFLQKQSGNTGGLTWATPPDTNTQVGGATGVDFNDNVKARFGTGNDLEVYHDGSHSWVKNTTGNTVLHTGTGNFKVWNGSNEEMIDAVPNGAVKLMYDDSLKFETTSNGVNITGTLNVNGSAFSSGMPVHTSNGANVGNGEAFLLTSNSAIPSSWAWNGSYFTAKHRWIGWGQPRGQSSSFRFMQIFHTPHATNYNTVYWMFRNGSSWSQNNNLNSYLPIFIIRIASS